MRPELLRQNLYCDDRGKNLHVQTVTSEDKLSGAPQGTTQAYNTQPSNMLQMATITVSPFDICDHGSVARLPERPSGIVTVARQYPNRTHGASEEVESIGMAS